MNEIQRKTRWKIQKISKNESPGDELSPAENEDY